MYHTNEMFFGLRTISLLGGDVIILKAIPIDKNVYNLCGYVPSQEIAVSSTISMFRVKKSHVKMYEIIDKKGFIETVYRRNYL